jgi:hypothetical protein
MWDCNPQVLRDYVAEVAVVSGAEGMVFFAEAAFFAVPLRAAFFAAAAAPALRAAFFSARLAFAHRFFCAVAIRSRASGLIVRRGGVTANSAGLKLVTLLGEEAAAGRPGFRFALVSVPVKISLTCSSRAIAVSS